MESSNERPGRWHGVPGHVTGNPVNLPAGSEFRRGFVLCMHHSAESRQEMAQINVSRLRSSVMRSRGCVTVGENSLVIWESVAGYTMR